MIRLLWQRFTTWLLGALSEGDIDEEKFFRE